MNTVITSKEAILAVSRELAVTEGLQSLNIRTIAEKCGISVGSVYNYFPSKADLIAATIEDVWKSIFQMDTKATSIVTFTGYVEWLFNSVQVGVSEYPNFFTVHSLGFTSADKGKGRHAMEQYFGQMKNRMLLALEMDSNIRENAFEDNFSKMDFIDHIFSHLLLLLMQNTKSCSILIEIIKRSIY